MLVKQVLKMASVLDRADLMFTTAFRSFSVSSESMVFISSIELGETLANSLIATLQNL